MYSYDLKQVAFRLYMIHNSLRKVSNILNVHYSTISKWFNKIERPRKVSDKILYKDNISNLLEQTIKENPFSTLSSLQIIMNANNIFVCKETIRRFLKNRNYSNKKVKYYSRPKNHEEKLKEFIEQRQKYINENRKFISIDETSFGRHFMNMYGYSKKGEKIYIQRKYVRITTTTSIAAMYDDKIIYNQIKGSCNSIVFLEFLKSLNLEEKQVLLIDNVSFHHSKIIKDFVKSKNCNILYNVPYSPIFNPIEGIFSIVKRAYYKCLSIKDSYNQINQNHITNFFKKSMNSFSQF